jgi:predicted nucleic acid-binding protein
VHLFIDTNILLSFYAYTNDDIEELRKLTKLITTKQLKLYLTEQVRDEFYRNRDAKLKESLRTFQAPSVPAGVPRFMETYPCIKEYRRALETLSKARDAAIQQAKKEAEDRSIAADTLFADISTVAKIIPTTDKVFEAATRRMNIGNPPGKPNSLGDRINWEILLDKVPDETDLHLISKDGDFGSPLLDGPNSYLVDEWRTKKHCNLALHDQLKPFLAQHFPQIKLAIDVEKRVAIDRLINSASFAGTHSVLQPFLDVLTPAEI